MKVSLPTGAWDCHAHVIGDPARYPLAPGRGYDPPSAPLAHYLALLDRLGIARGVLVQPSVYGFDNRCLLDAVARGRGRLLGIVVPSPDARPRDLERMHEQGVRGVRCNLLNAGGLPPQAAWPWRPVLLELGWHVELHVALEDVPDLRDFVARFGVPVVVDHMGRPGPAGLDPEAPGLRALVDLVQEGACYVKLSAPYRLSAEPPAWPDVTPLARALLAANPQACLWATDWPHTQTEAEIEPHHLMEALDDWCGEPGLLRRVLVDVPQRLFGAVGNTQGDEPAAEPATTL